MRNSGLYTFEKESTSEMLSEYDSIKKTFWVEMFIDNDRKAKKSR